MAHQALKITYDICLNNVKVQIADISDLLYDIIFDTNVFIKPKVYHYIILLVTSIFWYYEHEFIRCKYRVVVISRRAVTELLAYYDGLEGGWMM